MSHRDPYLKAADMEQVVQKPAQEKVTGRRARTWLVIVGALVLALAYAAIPRHADLSGFDANAMAQRETLMWRHYYEKRYAALFGDLYAVARDQYGFSPLDSVRIALAAANAARDFQPSTSAEEAEAALPELVTYFRILAGGASIDVEVEDAARTELAWWQARREAVTPEDYGAIIARVATLMYGIDNDEMRRSGVVRARAMAYRDAHGADMTEADWSAIEDQLRLGYDLLKRAIVSGQGRAKA
jgi:hypothetical protein